MLQNDNFFFTLIDKWKLAILQNEDYVSPHLLTRKNVFDCGILKNFHSLTTFIINFKEVIRGQNNRLLVTCMITKKTSSTWQVGA